MTDLTDTIALVTGASRGVGRGIAHELGLAGATVYITGRSREGEPTTDGLPGTIDETARVVTESGGRGVPVECDHTDDDAVERMAATITEEEGRLDLLVNNVWGGYEEYDAEVWQLSLWEQPIWRWDRMMRAGVRAHYTATRAVGPLLVRGRDPLIVNTSFGDDGKFLGDVQYDVAKAAVTRLGFSLSKALEEHGIVALTVYPGFARTERVAQNASPEALEGTHSPRFVGRAIVALAGDPDVAKKTGGAFKVGNLAREYRFTDVDGSRPEPFSIG